MSKRDVRPGEKVDITSSFNPILSSIFHVWVHDQDWHLGGKCDVFLWGAGRHGQLAEAGRNILVPTIAPSFSQAQQVHKHEPLHILFCELCFYN